MVNTAVTSVSVMHQVEPVTSGTQLLSLMQRAIPGLIKNKKGDPHSPCPWCGKHGEWIGEDRLVYFMVDKSNAAHPRVWCRHAATTGNHQPLHTLEELLEVAGHPIQVNNWEAILNDPALKRSMVRQRSRPGGGRIVSDAVVVKYHKECDRDYWSKMGFDDAVVDNFHLGTGIIEIDKGRIYHHKRGIVPIPLFPLIGQRWILKTRPMEQADTARHLAIAGQPPTLFYRSLDRDGKSVYGDTLYITEGERSSLAAWVLGYYPFAASSAGSSYWQFSWSKALVGAGYKNIVFIPDNDQAGSDMVSLVSRSLADAAFVSRTKIDMRTIAWPAGTKEKYDLYDLYADQGLTATEMMDELIATSSLTSETDRGKYLTAVPDLPAWPKPTPLEVLRSADHPESLNTIIGEFLDNYRNLHMQNGEPSLKLIAAYTGSGKSYRAVHNLERLARQRLARHDEIMRNRAPAIARLQQNAAEKRLAGDVFAAADLERQINRLQRKPRAFAYLYAGPFITGWQDILDQGADTSLWFNFEGRNEKNCANYALASVVGSKGYNVMRGLCHTSCPFADTCKAEGYMSQITKLRDYPIVYIRHQHLYMTDLTDAAHAIVVDEDATRLVGAPVYLEFNDLRVDLDVRGLLGTEQYDNVRYLLTAVAGALQDAPSRPGFASDSTLLSGRDAILHIEGRLSDLTWAVSLAEICRSISRETIAILRDRTPKGIDRIGTAIALPKKQVVDLIEILKYECDLLWPEEGTGLYKWNSRLHFVNGQLVIFPMEPIIIADNKPVLVLDATAHPYLYEQTFQRRVEYYAPMVRNPETKTIVWKGAEYSKSDVLKNVSINRPTGMSEDDWSLLAQRMALFHDEAAADALSQLGEVPDTVPNSAMQDVLTITNGLLQEHATLLVVTYLYAEYWLRQYLARHMDPAAFNRLSFGHYGGMRGSNAYKDLDAALLFGLQRLADVDMKVMAQAWYWNDLEPMDTEVVRIPEAYHGRTDGHMTRTLRDPRAHPLVSSWEVAEMVQCIERIRPHTSSLPKHVYVLTSRPAARWVTHIESRQLPLYIWNDLEDDLETIKMFDEEYQKTHGKSPSVHEVRRRLSKSMEKTRIAWSLYRGTADPTIEEE